MTEKTKISEPNQQFTICHFLSLQKNKSKPILPAKPSQNATTAEIAARAWVTERTFFRRSPTSGRRAEIIALTPALQERADAKAASVTAALASALEARGVEPKLANLAA